MRDKYLFDTYDQEHPLYSTENKKVYLNTGSGWRLSSSFVLPQPIVSNYSYTVGFVSLTIGSFNL
jgi:hypothetical protein